MRFLTLLWMLLLPFWAAAQFRAGSYVLAADSTVRHAGQLNLTPSNKELVLKNADGEKTRYTTKQVSSFRIGKHQYIRAGNFVIQTATGELDIDQAFVEQVDSGGVVLACYLMQNGAGMHGTSSVLPVYLLRTPPSRQFVPIPHSLMGDGGPKFRESLLPYLIDRTDLTFLVAGKRLTNNDLPALIRALNSGEPYDPTTSSGH